MMNIGDADGASGEPKTKVVDSGDTTDVIADPTTTTTASADQTIVIDFSGGSQHRPVAFRQIVFTMLRIVAPVSLGIVFRMLQQTVTLAVVGQRLGTEALSQYSVGQAIFNICGSSVCLGLTMALDTLASQAYGFDKKSPLVGELLQRAIIVSLVVAAPLAILFTNCAPVVISIFGPEIGIGASEFLSHSIPYLVMLTIFESHSRALQAQQLPLLPFCATCAATVACPFITLLFVPLGAAGMALSLACTTTVSETVLIILSACNSKVILQNAQWPSPKLRSWGRLRVYLSVAVSAMMSLCLEWWGIEIIMFLTTLIDQQAVAVFGISMNLLALLFAFPYGVQTASATCVGNALGANNPTMARQFIKCAQILSIAQGLTTATLCALFGRYLVNMETNDPNVKAELVGVVYAMSILHIFDSFQTMMNGVFRGAGKPYELTIIMLTSYWLVGIPCAGIVGVGFNQRVAGIWAGFLCGMFVEIPLQLREKRTWDLVEIARQAVERASAPSKKILELVAAE